MIQISEIEKYVRMLLKEYHAEYAVLFGSYARGCATANSDIDIIVFGGEHFVKTDIFAFAEDLRTLTGKEVDAYEISEVECDTPFYTSIKNEGLKIA